MTAYLLERAWVDGRVQDRVRVEVVDGRFAAVVPGGSSTGAERVAGLTLPGLANGHSHAFHRVLRGRTQRERGTFWTWRDQMYAVADRLDPDSYRALAVAVFREMVAAGITAVGEFHYLHHGPDGRPYDDPNAMGLALVEAAAEAGLRITLLDTCYLSAGLGSGGGALPVEGVQRRYSDGDVDRWLERVDALAGVVDRAHPHARVGHAYHSVRAVPREQLRPLGGPVHVHLSEQRAENDACLAAHGLTPAQLLAEAGVLTGDTTLVHATHLTDGDVAALGAARAHACFCPTTERDLGDGVGPSRRLHGAGARLTLGSDSQAVVDLFEEMRAVELDERLATESRGHWSAAELLGAGLRHDSLGWTDAGEIAVGRRADLVTLDTTSPRTAGTGADEHTAVFAATAADVVRVVVDGRLVLTAEERGDVGRALDVAVRSILEP